MPYPIQLLWNTVWYRLLPIAMQILFWLIAFLFASTFALLARWLQLHPEKLPPRGSFESPSSSGARLYRMQVAFIGTFAVFGGVCGAVFYALTLLTFGSEAIAGFVILISIAAGVLSAIHVRRDVNRKVHYVAGDHGLWP